MSDTDEELQPLEKEPNVWYDPQGRTITLCVLCEIDPRTKTSTQAVMVISGVSMCKGHGIAMIEGVIGGASMADIFKAIQRL